MKYKVSFRCYFGREYNTHYQEMPLKDIPKWITAYRFTHPYCTAITVKVTFDDERGTVECIDLPLAG